MKKIVLAIAYVGIAAGFAPAADQSFQRTKIPDAKGNQTPVGLVFSDGRQAVQVSSAGHVVTEVPYGSIDKLSYEHTHKHRITQGAVVMVASLGAGAVVMLTKSKSHFLNIEYHDGAAPAKDIRAVQQKRHRKKENSNVEFQKH